MIRKSLIGLLCFASAAALAMSQSPTLAGGAGDPFYRYDGRKPLASIPPGTVIKRRIVDYHVLGLRTAVHAQQLLYRTDNARKQPVVNVTSVIVSPFGTGRAISFQSAYDSLNPLDEPSRVIAGDRTLGGVMYSGESVPLATLLLAGYDIIVPDTEEQGADFSVGPEYGMATLDSVRAALSVHLAGLGPASKVAMIGYSGGAIATNWAAQLAPTYAPDVNRHLVGAAEGGLLVDPAHNLRYVDGSVVWSGVALAAIAGIVRTYGIDFTPYMSAKGVATLTRLQHQSLLQFLPSLSRVRWETMLKPEYANDPNRIPVYVATVNKVNAGLAGAPTIPMYIRQGTLGALNGTFGREKGDGVMIAGDVRSLARQFCASGTPVSYAEYPLDHFATALVWMAGMVPWLNDRFAGKPVPSNCAEIPPGNSLAAETLH